MNDHDEVCVSEAVSSVSEKTAGHPAGLPPNSIFHIEKNNKKYTQIYIIT